MNAISGPFEDGKTKASGKDGAQGTIGVFETIGISGEEVSKGIGASRMHGVAGNAGAAAETETAGAAGAPARTGFPGAIEVSGDAGAFGGKTGKSANVKRLEARLRGLVGKAIVDYRMIEDGDRVMACVSGGKDSHAMVHMLVALARNAPVNFEVVAVNLDQKQPGFPSDVLPAYFASRGIPFESIEQDTYGIVKRVLPEGKTMCGLCSRLRRGVLYRHAAKRGFTRIALGHHRDDVIETLFMNMFHGGRLRAMPPKLRSDDGRHIVIRPLAYCAENDLHRLARAMRFPIIPCNLCGSQDGLERQRIKTMLAQWERESPGRTAQIFRALQHVGPSHLADRALFDFESLQAGRPPAHEGLHQVAENRS